MDLKKKPKLIKDVEYKEIDNETLIFLPDEGTFFELNQVGSIVWNLCTGKNTVQSIIHTITNEFDINYTLCKKDVTGYLNELVRKGLIK